jgi:hypothetical protein
MIEFETKVGQPVVVGPLRMSKMILAISAALMLIIVWAIGSMFPRVSENSSIIDKLLSNQSVTFAGAFLLGCWAAHVLNTNRASGINPDIKMWIVAFLAGHFGSQVFPLLF